VTPPKFFASWARTSLTNKLKRVSARFVSRPFESIKTAARKAAPCRVECTASWRAEVEREIDLIEEIARIYGPR